MLDMHPLKRDHHGIKIPSLPAHTLQFLIKKRTLFFEPNGYDQPHAYLVQMWRIDEVSRVVSHGYSILVLSDLVEVPELSPRDCWRPRIGQMLKLSNPEGKPPRLESLRPEDLVHALSLNFFRREWEKRQLQQIKRELKQAIQDCLPYPKPVSLGK